MLRTVNKNLLLGVAILTAVMVAGFVLLNPLATRTATAEYQSGSVVDPEVAAAGPNSLVPPAPFLAPPDTEPYTALKPGAGIISQDGRHIAILAAAPINLAGSVETFIPALEALPEGVAAHSILSSIRYRGARDVVLVTTATRTPASAQKPELLGTKTVQLANGTKAWTTTGMPFETPNQVVFLHKDLIITVAGNIPVEQLKELAVTVVIL